MRQATLPLLLLLILAGCAIQKFRHAENSDTDMAAARATEQRI